MASSVGSASSLPTILRGIGFQPVNKTLDDRLEAYPTTRSPEKLKRHNR